MISSTGRNGAAIEHGVELPLRTFTGALAVRVISGGNTVVEEHSHDWPILSLFVMGDCRKIFDGGDVRIRGPSAVLHGASEAHANRLGEVGLEQIDLQFDPRWLGRDTMSRPLKGVRCWLGGPVAAAAARLRSLWSRPATPEAQLVQETRRFLDFALVPRDDRGVAWLPAVLKRIQIDAPPSASELGATLGLHPSWLAQAYRRATGEGLRQTIQRRRVEHAAMLLRSSDHSAADIAAAAGFCDQSHMNRTFRSVLQRTPGQIRAERERLAATLRSSGSQRPGC